MGDESKVGGAFVLMAERTLRARTRAAGSH